MGNSAVTPKTIDEYISQFPVDVQQALLTLRQVIHDSAPDAEEKISWQMPTFFLNGNLVHFAAYKKHIGFYPGADGIDKFKDRLSEYKWAKGSVQFPFDKPIPFGLVSEIVKYRVAGQSEKKK